MERRRNSRSGRKRGSRAKSNNLDRRALLSKLAAGLAFTAAGSAKALDFNVDAPSDKKRGKIPSGEHELVELSTGSIAYDPSKFTVKCKDGVSTYYCPKEIPPSPTPTPK